MFDRLFQWAMSLRRGLWIAAALLAVGSASPTTAGDALRVVNVTSDSVPGWVPTVEQERGALGVAQSFLAALDGGRAGEAYGLLAESNRADRPLATFADAATKFHAISGAVRERRILKVTWTKDPPRGPFPGVYAAIDLLSRFDGVDRHCGYLVVYQPPSGGDFQVMRQQDVYMDNATARSIQEKGSAQKVDETWASLSSSSCPNYPRDAAPLTETPGASQYPSVDAALRALKARPGISFSTQNGWTIAVDKEAKAIWSFAPTSHPAYPAVVKRQVIQSGEEVSMAMNVQCEASKVACDALVREFQAMNNTALGRR